MTKQDPHICDVCGGDFDFLYTRQAYLFSSSVEFVCKDCYKETFGIEWNTDFKENHEKEIQA